MRTAGSPVLCAKHFWVPWDCACALLFLVWLLLYCKSRHTTARFVLYLSVPSCIIFTSTFVLYTLCSRYNAACPEEMLIWTSIMMGENEPTLEEQRCFQRAVGDCA